MTLPQGRFTFPGVTRVISASYVYSHGITPGVISLVIPPAPSIQKTGNAVFTYDTFTLTLANCLLESIDKDTSNGEEWRVTILDERWKWRFGHIAGQYNVRIGKKLIDMTEKSSQELAQLCLDAMGIASSDVSALPSDDTPYVDWQEIVPAKALAEVADKAGCRVVWRPDGFVDIVKVGTGASLPTGWLYLNGGVEPAALPGKIVVAAGPTQWQLDLKLRAVGREADGLIVPVDNLSYKPVGGWEKQDYRTFHDVTPTMRGLAEDSVWKMYEVDVENTSFEGLPSDPAPPEVTELLQLCPMHTAQVEIDSEGYAHRPRPPWVWGKFYDRRKSVGKNSTKDPLPDNPDLVEDDHKLRYMQGFQVERDIGLVRFSHPVYLFGTAPGAAVTLYREAEIYLRIAVSIRDVDSRAPYRAKKEYAITGQETNANELWIVREDLQIQYYKDQNGDWQDNAAEIEPKMDEAAQLAAEGLVTAAPATAVYPGFLVIVLDGALTQATFRIDERGRATTTVSRLQEHTLQGSGTYKERRNREKLISELSERDRERSRPELK